MSENDQFESDQFENDQDDNQNDTVEGDQDQQLEQWSREYDQIINSSPEDGAILTTVDGSPAVLAVELVSNQEPFIYGRAFVPEVVGGKLGWFLQSAAGHGFHGWKCVLMPRARTETTKRHGLQHPVIEVVSLKVIRQSKSRKSLLCEVHQYCEVQDDESSDIDTA